MNVHSGYSILDRCRSVAFGGLVCLLLFFAPVRADIVADSFDDWSIDGIQGENDWYNGYYNLTVDEQEGDGIYEVDDFVEFLNDDSLNVDADGLNHWDGGQFLLYRDTNPDTGPWTRIGQEHAHPNGTNSAAPRSVPNSQPEEHWSIRRWVADSINVPSEAKLTWELRKQNLNCGGGTGGFLFLNGEQLDDAVIPFDDDIGIVQEVEAVINPGDIVDLALTPENFDGSRGDSCDGSLYRLTIEVTGTAARVLQAGDANMDYEFNQLDLVQVQIAAKYLTGQPATWGEGDWNGAPGGEAGSPPAGDGLFNQQDIIAALAADVYLKGPYAALAGPAPPNGADDEQTSIIYNPSTGELGVNAPASKELTSINIDSAGAIFTGEPAQNLGGSFDNDADNNIFKATFGSSFGSLSFGNVAPAGLSQDFLLNDLTVVGSLSGGGDLGPVDLIYVPEPSTILLLGLAWAGALGSRRRWG